MSRSLGQHPGPVVSTRPQASRNDNAGLLLLEERNQSSLLCSFRLISTLPLSFTACSWKTDLAVVLKADHGNTHRGRSPFYRFWTTRICGTPMPGRGSSNPVPVRAPGWRRSYAVRAGHPSGATSRPPRALEHQDVADMCSRRVGHDGCPVGSRALSASIGTVGIVAARAFVGRIAMTEENFAWFAGIDWGSERHQACLVDAQGRIVGEREFFAWRQGPG